MDGNAREHAIKVLEELLLDKNKRSKRKMEFLKRPEADYSQGWHICVPKCFNVALDIQLTERKVNGKAILTWTQGSKFSFQEGDVLYNTIEASQEWSQALRRLKYCVRILSASDAIPAQKNNPRNPGLVKFKIQVPDEKMKFLIEHNEYSMTQDEFVSYLIQGFLEEKKGTKKESPRESKKMYEVEELELFSNI